jgi:hypothetical protein
MGWLLQVQVSKLRFKLEVTLGRESVCILILQVRTKEILAGELEWISTIEDEVFVHPACQEFAGKGKPCRQMMRVGRSTSLITSYTFSG